jgi:hypothetical protein
VVHARPEYHSGAGRRAGQALNVPLTIARRCLLWPWRPLRARAGQRPAPAGCSRGAVTTGGLEGRRKKTITGTM